MIEERKNVFQELALSVWNFKSYGQFITNKGGKVFGFSILLAGIYILISTIASSFGFFHTVADIRQDVMARLPDFVLEDGMLTVEDTFEFDEDGVYIYVNTNTHIDPAEVQEIFRQHNSVVLMDASGIALQSSDGKQQALSYADLQEMLGGERYTKESLDGLMYYVYIIWAVFCVLSVIGRLIAFYVRTVVVSLCVLIIAYLMKMNYSYGKVFKLSIYTRTVPVLLRLLCVVIGISVPFFWLIDLAVSSLYAFLALDAVKKAEGSTPAGYGTAGF